MVDRKVTKGGDSLTLDQYITSVLTSIADGIHNCNDSFEEDDPVFHLAGGDDHFIEFQIAVELVKKAATDSSAKVGLKIPYIGVGAQLSAHDGIEGTHRNIVKFKVRAAERAVFSRKSQP
jgi:hypothetical protein